jgi:hypothetical protein
VSWLPEMPDGAWVLLWLGWYLVLVLGVFLALEAWAIATGGVTFTGTVAWLRSHHIGVLAGLGALTVALVVWRVFHFFLQPDFFPRTRGKWWIDGIIAAVAFVGSWLIARRARKKQQDDSTGPDGP